MRKLNKHYLISDKYNKNYYLNNLFNYFKIFKKYLKNNFKINFII